MQNGKSPCGNTGSSINSYQHSTKNRHPGKGFDKEEVEQAAKGRWQAILPALGMDQKFLSNKHGPCPSCGGKDRFRFDDKDGTGTFICSQCGSGDGFSMAARLLGHGQQDFPKTLQAIANVLGIGDESQPARNHSSPRAAPRYPDTQPDRSMQAIEKAQTVWRESIPASEGHPYLLRKGVRPTETLREIGLGRLVEIIGYHPQGKSGPFQGETVLVAPIRMGDELTSLSLIDQEGQKHFLAGGQIKGGYWSIRLLPGSDKPGLFFLVGEGVATSLSACQAVPEAFGVAALMNSNLLAVSQFLRQRFPKAKITVLSDLQKTDGTPDKFAVEAAMAVSGFLAVPDFGQSLQEGNTDFNDLHRVSGLEVVRQLIETARDMIKTTARKQDPRPVPILGARGGSNDTEWLEPSALSAKVEPEPYPIDALPPGILEAVKEVHEFVKAPFPMVATAALVALSLATQAHIDVQRSEKLHGPVSLFSLVIADSGERKSTCDGFFTTTLKEYQETQANAAKPILKDYEAMNKAWEAKCSGIKEKIRQLAKTGKSTEEAETFLRKLEHEKPKSPRIPRLLYTDVTPEALAFGLAKKWPSGGVVSSEAGIVFGSHGMGKDSAMRNLGLLNQLWDGTSITIDRRTSESFVVKGVRLTIALQVQEPTLRGFLDQTGVLARGSGFLARFLVSWPESTQGSRPFTEAPSTWPNLAKFNRRISEILERQANLDEDGALTLTMLSMTLEAKTAWIEYHNAIEIELSSGGELYDVRDVASKSADNAVRLAALFQHFDGPGKAICEDSFDRASQIAAWHLSESRRFFGELALPEELGLVVRLDEWLIEFCCKNKTNRVPISQLQQFGPGRLRSKAAIRTAMIELEATHRAKTVIDGKRKIIAVNPKLLNIGGIS